MAEEKGKALSGFHRYLTLWVLLCMGVGTLLGWQFPAMAQTLDSWSVYNVSIPVGILLFFMMYPIMVQIDFGKVIEAGKNPKPVLLTLVVNWAIKPFTMAFFAWLSMNVLFRNIIGDALGNEYFAGMILLGIAPCTAMVLVWGYLSKSNMGHTLVMVAINSLTMLVLYAPLGRLLLDAAIPVPFMTIFLSVLFYVGLPLAAGAFSRYQLIKSKGIHWFETVFLKSLDKVAITALLTTLVALFVLQGQRIIDTPIHVGLIAIPLIVQTFVIFIITYFLAHRLGIVYEDAAPSAMIGASNHFEVAIATATVVFGLHHGAALATVVGVLIEVPIMLALVRICLRTRHWFKSDPQRAIG